MYAVQSEVTRSGTAGRLCRFWMCIMRELRTQGQPLRLCTEEGREEWKWESNCLGKPSALFWDDIRYFRKDCKSWIQHVVLGTEMLTEAGGVSWALFSKAGGGLAPLARPRSRVWLRLKAFQQCSLAQFNMFMEAQWGKIKVYWRGPLSRREAHSKCLEWLSLPEDTEQEF